MKSPLWLLLPIMFGGGVMAMSLLVPKDLESYESITKLIAVMGMGLGMFLGVHVVIFHDWFGNKKESQNNTSVEGKQNE